MFTPDAAPNATAFQAVWATADGDLIRLEGRLIADLAVGDVLVRATSDGDHEHVVTRIEAYGHPFRALDAGMTAAVWVSGESWALSGPVDFGLAVGNCP